jgi:hypothetical protein
VAFNYVCLSSAAPATGIKNGSNDETGKPRSDESLALPLVTYGIVPRSRVQ